MSRAEHDWAAPNNNMKSAVELVANYSSSGSNLGAHAHSWDRASASRFGENASAMDAALVAVASSLLSLQSKAEPGVSASGKLAHDSPVYFSDTSTRAASLTRTDTHNPVDALIAELVSNNRPPPPDFALEHSSHKQVASASVCRSTFFDREAFSGFDWTPSPSAQILTSSSSVARRPAHVSVCRKTAYARTRTLSHSSSPQLPNEGLTLRGTCRAPAASYHGNRRPLPPDSVSSATSTASPDLARLRRPSSAVSGQNEPQPSQMDENLSALREAKLEALLKSLNLTLDHTHNAVVSLPDCVKMILPLSAEGETLSIGSLLHYSGGCRNCIFNSGRQGCHNGLNCVFCHHSHPRPKRRSRRRVTAGNNKQNAEQS